MTNRAHFFAGTLSNPFSFGMNVCVQAHFAAFFVQVDRLITIPLLDRAGLFRGVDTPHSTGWEHDQYTLYLVLPLEAQPSAREDADDTEPPFA